MIEFSALQLSLMTSLVLVVAWCIRLEGSIKTERELRIQRDKNDAGKETANNSRVMQLEGRILDEVRGLRADITRFQDRLDTKMDKE